MSNNQIKQDKNKKTENKFDVIKTFLSYSTHLTKHTVFLSGFVIIFYFYYLRNKSSNTTVISSARGSYSRMIIFGLLLVFFYRDIIKFINKNTKDNKQVNNTTTYENPIYSYGTQIKEPNIKTSKLERNTREIWKQIKKFKHTSPELVKDIYYHLQYFQYEIKALHKKDAFLYQYFDKLNDRKDEIMNLLESLEYIENLDLTRLKKDTSDFLLLSIKQVKDKLKNKQVNATCGTIHITNDVYSIE